MKPSTTRRKSAKGVEVDAIAQENSGCIETIEALRTSYYSRNGGNSYFFTIGSRFSCEEAFLKNEASLNEVQSRFSSKKISQSDFVHMICENKGCKYAVKAGFSTLDLKWKVTEFVEHSCVACPNRGPRQSRSNYTAQQLAETVSGLFAVDARISCKTLFAHVSKHTSFPPTKTLIQRIKQKSILLTFGDPREEIKKLPAFVHLLRHQGHEVELLFKNPMQMKQIALNVARQDHACATKNPPKKTCADLLSKESDSEKSPQSSSAITENCKIDLTWYDFLSCDLDYFDTLPEETKFFYGFNFAPCTTIRIGKAGHLPNATSCDGAHMLSVGTLLTNVFRCKGFHINPMSHTAAFDNENGDAWNENYSFQNKHYDLDVEGRR